MQIAPPQNGLPTLDDVEKITEPVKKRDPKEPYLTEKGVILRLQKISTDVVRRAWTAIPIPKPPEVWIEDHGRFEANPADPGYNNELSLYNNRVSGCIQQIIMMRAVDVMMPLPDGVEDCMSDDWTEGLEDYFVIPKGRLARKAMWLLDYILSDAEIDDIMKCVMEGSGMVMEKQVEETQDSFRNNGSPTPVEEVPNQTGDTD